MTTQSQPITLTPRPPNPDPYNRKDKVFGEDIKTFNSGYQMDEGAVIDVTLWIGNRHVRVRLAGSNYVASAYLNAAQLRELAQACIDAAHDLEAGE